jgi:hypothetical protein
MNGSPLLTFWQLGSAGMLAWGLAAALPILIHLWSRRKYREESWAAMTFLLAALRKNARRIQLEQWILLAVRTLLVALFALALADPQLSVISAWVGGAGGQAHVVLVVDGSFSMDYRRSDSDGGLRGDKSRFEAARQLAKEIVQAGRQGDGYTLVQMGEPPRVVIAQPAFDPRDVLEELDNLELAHWGASLPATLAEIETMLRKAAESHPRLARRRVIVLTDLQQTTWGDVDSSDSRQRLARLADLATLQLIDLGQPGEQNLAVTNLQVGSASGGLIAARTDVTIRAELRSFAAEDRAAQAVELLVDGQRIADERVDLPAGGTASVSVAHQFDTAGDRTIEVRLADDSLPLDNRRWLSVPVREAVRVLCVGGRPEETRHLALALQPRKGAGANFEIIEASESRLVEGDLSTFDCVFLCNVGRISQDEAGVLARYILRGGGLVIFLGDQVQAESYNQLLLDRAESRILPARLGAAAATGSHNFAEPDYRHPIVSPFRGHETSGLLTTPVWKYVRLAPSQQAKVALAFSNGEAAVVEEQFGRGRTILVATAASPASIDRTSQPPTPWTALSSWPSFPPLVHEMLQFAALGQSEGRNLLVGDELTGELSAGGLDKPIALVGPDGLSEKLPVIAEGSGARWTFGGTAKSGLYEARADEFVQRFAVNVNPRESDLARFDPELLPSQLAREPIGAEDDQPLTGTRDSSSYYWALLAGVLGLLLVEPVLAWHFGRGRG